MNDFKHEHDEISLKDLIVVILSGWKAIIAITLVIVMTAAGYVLFIADTVYESHQRGIISIPESTETHFGTYVYPSTNKFDYLDQMTSDDNILKVIELHNLETSIDRYKSNIQVVSEKDRNAFQVKLKASSAEDAQNQLKTLINVFEKSIMQDYKDKARTFFMRDYYVRINRMTENLKIEKDKLFNYEEVLDTIEPTITLQKLVLTDPILAAQVAKEKGTSLENLTGQAMLEEVVNPNYYDLEKLIVEQKTNISNIESTLLQLLDQYEILESNTLEEGMLEIMRSKIVFSGDASFPEKPIAPRKLVLLSISIVFGLMVGVFVTLFKSYWKNA